MTLTKRMALKERGIMHSLAGSFQYPFMKKALHNDYRVYFCIFKIPAPRRDSTSVQMASRYILGGNGSDEEREDYRHLDPTLLKRMRRSLMLQCHISGRNRLLLFFHCFLRALLFSQWDCRADWLRCSEH